MSKLKNRDFIKKWKLTRLTLNAKFLNLEFLPSEKDKDTAWALYVELQTRVTTQCLPHDAGDEKTALDSVYSIFKTTREILIKNGRESKFCTPVALAMLNSVIRAFTAKWHKASGEGAFDCPDKRKEFRDELAELQIELTKFSALFAAIAYGEASEVDVTEFLNEFEAYEEP
ncbi:MAG: hypothetical protein LBI54_02035 [Lachnospiraceae bacterium]|nr:hypothetical protein [Lachnospiraceae bacterium]